MKSHWLHRNGSDTVILFFSGWGTDFQPFLPIPSGGCDVLCLYAYHCDATPDWDAILAPYQHHHLIAWSMGVLQAEREFAGSGITFSSALAVNGTLCPVHDRWGIPRSGYQLTIDSFSEPALRKFIQRMCKDRAVITRYTANLPQREIDEQKDELIFHQQQSELFGSENPSLFSTALIGSADLIFPPANLQRFWDGKVRILEVDLPHFPFYQFDSWSEILAL